MSNPAELLYNLFTTWQTGNTAEAARGDSAGLPRHRQAVAYLNQIDELLDVMDSQGRRTDPFRNLFPVWVNHVFAYPRDWKHSNSVKIDRPALQGLEMLIGYFDDIVHAIDEDKLATLGDYLEEVLEEIKADDSIGEQLKREATVVVEHIRGCIDDLSVIGAFGFQQAMDRLIAILVRLTIESAHKERWKTLFEHFVWPFSMGNATAVSGSFLTALMQ